MFKVETEFATVQWTDDGCVSKFWDGSEYGAQPHDLPHYHALAHRLGYAGDTMRFCREHEVAHHLVAEVFHHPSRVLFPLAHGRTPWPEYAASEEGLALALQRYARANEVPLIDCVNWPELRDEFLDLLEAQT